MRNFWRILVLGAALGSSFACSDEPLPQQPEPTPSDLIPYTAEDGKSDGYGFNANHIIDDEVFEDPNFLTPSQVQTFLEFTPYERRSFLADHEDDGKLASVYIVEAAQQYRINPLVLLVKLQVESSAVFKSVLPQDTTGTYPMGCGCYDGDPNCSRGPEGVGPQIECAARLFRSYLDELDNASTTRSGWQVNRAKRSLDELAITPRNRATAALYTYTPWVLTGRGGNWLFWNVYHRFAEQLLENHPNHRFIGGPCITNDDCLLADGFCHFSVLDSDRTTGVCTQPCDLGCPDRQQPNTSITFCMNTQDGGLCMSRCDERIFPENEGCDTNLACVETHRPSDESRTQSVCGPPELQD